ncbi:class I SAM-dependent methyltransferase [Patescibacteria group bacterium]|nr:MAG: class I SAM-dependent methyltransferase [Patescibacteria group bacterium]
MVEDLIQKTRDDYNRIAKYFSATREYVRPEFKYFGKFIKDGQKILDWGCGNGRMVFCLKGKKVKYFGIDQSAGLLKIARKKFTAKDGSIKFFCTGARAKKFPSEYFDLVFAISSLFHLPDQTSRLKVLNEFYREMKKGAKLVVMVWNLDSDWAKAKAKKSWKKIDKNDFLIPWKTPAGELLAERYYHHFTPAELKKLLTSAGFKVQKMEFVGKNGTWSDYKGGQNLVAAAVK